MRLYFLIIVFSFLCFGCTSFAENYIPLSDPEIINAKIDQHRPLKSKSAAGLVRDRIGITHYGGRYHLTEKPFLAEGLEKIVNLNFRITKLWLSSKSDQVERGYYYNSTWPKFNRKTKLVDVARLQYFEDAFDKDIDTFLLEVNIREKELWRAPPYARATAYFKRVESEFYELSSYLLRKYADRSITFVLHNWAGDRLLQNSGGYFGEKDFLKTGKVEDVPADIYQRIEGMIEMFNARQRGVERARRENVKSRAKVYHAVKINKFWGAIRKSAPEWSATLKVPSSAKQYQLPTVLTHVVPKITPDMVICAAYEGSFDHPVSLWHTIEIIKGFVNPSQAFGSNNVAIGEIGFREYIQRKSKAEVVDYWDSYLAIVSALDLPFMVFWNLYGNEAVDGRGKVIPTGDYKHRGLSFPAE